MLKNEYLRFMISMENSESPNIIKMANLILANFDELVSLNTYQGQRVKKIVELASRSWSNLSEEIPPLPTDSSKINTSMKRMVSVEIGPFRGFAKQEVLCLDSSIVLIYGPNGTGKTSFCEALEYGLLGSVAEADNKRFKEQGSYLKNAHTESFIPPRLLGRSEQDEEVEIEPDQELYQFCFIERNRIDSFSRIAAQLPAKQTELTSTLFGLDAFNDFVKGFSPNIDDRYIDLTGKKAGELRDKEQSTEHHAKSKVYYTTQLEALEHEEKALAEKYKTGYTFLQMDEELNGKQNIGGEIHRIELEIRNPIPAKSSLTLKSINEVRQKIIAIHDEILLDGQALTDNSKQVSYKALYESVQMLQKDSPDHCPACKTSVNSTNTNPFTNATLELEKLEYLAKIQTKINKSNALLNDSLVKLNNILRKCNDYSDDDFFQVYLKNKSSELNIEWFYSLINTNSDGYLPWSLIENIVKNQELEDSKIAQILEDKELNHCKLEEMKKISDQIIRLKANKETFEGNLKAADELIEQFREENAELIKEVELERDIITENILISESYHILIKALNEYKNKLPIDLVADLGEMTTKLYNAFNRYDERDELIERINLPLAQNEKLLISFKTSPEKQHNALHVLSEGHIRCLGLAILLAKNIKNNCPFIVFDDPVNSIDDEHRMAIRETLFKDDFFKDKQVILACHGEEFFKDIHQLIGLEATKKTESYIFLPQSGENHIQVTSTHRSKNYILAASELYAHAEYRDALMSSRRALESICDKAWWHYSKNCSKSDGDISINKQSPKAPLSLMALAQNICSKLKSSKADIPNKEEIVQGFNLLLGIGKDGNKLYWEYLNKGTHQEDDRDEFDHNTISKIIKALETLDAALT